MTKKIIGMLERLSEVDAVETFRERNIVTSEGFVIVTEDGEEYQVYEMEDGTLECDDTVSRQIRQRLNHQFTGIRYEGYRVEKGDPEYAAVRAAFIRANF